MRRGEILSLAWSQIDFSRNLIHIVRTKTGKARSVPINSAVREQLLALKVYCRSEYVFTRPTKKRPLRRSKRSFASACEKAKIFGPRFHDLRHTAATRLAETGAEPTTIKDILGHSTLAMTDRYTHAVENRKREALERIADFPESTRDSGDERRITA